MTPTMMTRDQRQKFLAYLDSLPDREFKAIHKWLSAWHRTGDCTAHLDGLSPSRLEALLRVLTEVGVIPRIH